MSNDGLGSPNNTQKLTADSSASSTLNSNSDTLRVDSGNVTLSLHSDYLSINDTRPNPVATKQSLCCGLIPLRKPAWNWEIPYKHLLSASLESGELAIGYANKIKKDAVKPAILRFKVSPTQQEPVNAFVERILDLAYPKSQRRKRIKVLINPHGGRGKAEQLFKEEIAPIFELAGCEVNVEVTKHVGHARELAQKIDIKAWDVIACASGDGTPHEVFNGLAEHENPRRALSKIAIVQLPCGSGNAMSFNLLGTTSPSLAALETVKGVKSPLDLVSITQGDKRYLSFLSQAVGIVAECDLGSESLRWMGAARFEFEFLLRVLGKTIYPVEIWVGVESTEKSDIRQAFKKQTNLSMLFEQPPVEPDSLPPLKFGTVKDAVPSDWTHIDYPNLGNFYCGNMAYMSVEANFFPYSLPCEGRMDLLTVDGDIPRRRALMLADAVKKNELFSQPESKFWKVTGYRIVPKAKEGYISVDGERVPFEPFQTEVHQGLGTVLTRSSRLYFGQEKLL